MTAYVSAFDLFSIGIGPSSSHTVGPMRAARDFAQRLTHDGVLNQVARVTCVLYGSLGSTGIGHGTPGAVIAGLSGLSPETCLPIKVRNAWAALETGPRILLGGTHSIVFTTEDIQFEPRTRLPGHPNALRLRALSENGDLLSEETYYSVGGGFIRREGDEVSPGSEHLWPMPFATSAALIALCEENNLHIDQIALANELSQHSMDEVTHRLDAIWDAMHRCVEAGLNSTGILPGGLQVKRRAAELREHLVAADTAHDRDTTTEWLHAFALAVNEENAAGGRVVTAPTNGAAGIVPAVASYYLRFVNGADADGIHRYLLTATAIGSLFKANASISGAEAGCQGEIGPACAMAAGGLCAVLGGTPRQVENAAEIAMEHHLGLTCDPVGGLVQIPCIERNAIAASTAVSAARLALHGDGSHVVSLDTVIETMRQTGLDMSTKYKETSEGGLAVNVIEC
ncbi:L-serine dehydratase [Aurantimicrobium minutum]|uniref:L-serine ammonia-lyase n=1 Tax=Aurantimicrobium minutum TaxID=708131 RepID=UPI0024755EE9|nr:L-serine ammonia-lyase [Aurantimicrobium minutum]MDH6532475.1 L-serine dehydratase [Aurantimicrobium minutum]